MAPAKTLLAHVDVVIGSGAFDSIARSSYGRDGSTDDFECTVAKAAGALPEVAELLSNDGEGT